MGQNVIEKSLWANCCKCKHELQDLPKLLVLGNGVGGCNVMLLMLAMAAED